MDNTTKICIVCQAYLSLDSFYTRDNSLDGRYNRCKKCYREYTKQYRLKNSSMVKQKRTEYEIMNSEYLRAAHLLRMYTLSYERYLEMLAEQDNACDICLETFDKTPHVDHDRLCCSGVKSCGKCVRGLLCSNCNLMLGKVKDNQDTLRRAADYLNGAFRYS